MSRRKFETQGSNNINRWYIDQTYHHKGIKSCICFDEKGRSSLFF